MTIITLPREPTSFVGEALSAVDPDSADFN
jgi:hypothetical protein